MTFELGGDIILRRFEERDAEAVFSAVRANLQHLHTFLLWAVEDYSLSSAREFIAAADHEADEGKSLSFGIFEGNQVIGSIGFCNVSRVSRRAEIGYWIGLPHQGRGIVTEACKLLIDHAFNDLGLNRVEIRCATGNRRSRAIPERLGFVREGTLRQSEWRHTHFNDTAIFGMLKKDWKAADAR
jgi:ribosomal-protein-serine acetyltransferase